MEICAMADREIIVLPDAEAVARVYVEAWRDTYPLVLPAKLLLGMSVEGQCARWRNAIAMAAREAVYVAEDDKGAIHGMASLGRARDTALGYDAEIYTLYVSPMMTGLGGAFFKRNADGSYDPNSVQVDARALLKNAGIIEYDLGRTADSVQALRTDARCDSMALNSPLRVELS